jgi:P-type Na+/K+ transporter
MGIETLPDVEESTEPPICALREYNLNPHGTAALSVEHANEKPTPAPTTHSLSPSIDLHVSPESLQGSEDQIQKTHLLEPARIAELLKTDLKYGTAHCTPLILELTRDLVVQQWIIQC